MLTAKEAITNDGTNHLPAGLFSSEIASSLMLQPICPQVIFRICGNGKPSPESEPCAKSATVYFDDDFVFLFHFLRLAILFKFKLRTR
jgi:hypothetical protein